MVEAAGTDWMQSTIDKGFADYDRLRAAADENERLGGDFTELAMEKLGDIEDELISQLPPGLLARLAIMAAFEDHEQYLGPHYDESQGADDGAEFRAQFRAELADRIEFLKEKWIEEQP